MPKALRKCMVSKFCEFDQNQLAQCKRRLSSACFYRCKVSGRGAGDAAVDAVTDTLQSRLVDPSPIHFTLKELVRKLHISKPALNVMCILGKLYPSDVTAFSKTGLEGDWDASKAGACMKLPVHPKWKVELASGKSRDAWIKIIMSGDLCHELILRNLKSILCSRISQTGHNIVLQRLSDAELVIEGKQLPFVYLTAYITVEKLHDMLSMTANRKRLKDMRLQESNKIRSKYLYRSRSSRVRSLNINKGLLNKYLLALTKAMSLSTRYNLSPIRCSVLVICSLCSGFELQKIRRSTRVKAIINVLSFIYGAICNAICENAVVYFVVDNDYNVASINRMLLLLYSSLWHTEENKKDTSLFRSPNPPLMDKIKLIYKNRKLWESYSLSLTLDRFSAFRRKFDKVIVFGDCPDSIAKYVVNYRANIGPIKAIWNNLSGNDKWCTSFPMTGWIESKGLVDNIFKYLSLPDDKCLVEQIDKIDETYKLNSMFDLPLQMNLSSEQQGHNKLSQIKSSQESFCRVYISSSYIDMHAEHDLIYHTLVPNLCQNVAQTCSTCLDLVDLRIGVPQSITCSLIALEMYLKQAAASDIFILLLGDKYGWVPDESLVRALPDSLLAEVNKFYKPGMSVTEMEYHMVKLAAVNKLSRSSFNMFPSTVFVFIRDFNTSDIPNEYGQIFRDHDPVNLQHLDAFKQLLLNDGVSILSYSARFIGVIDDRPMMGNLDNFANQFISTLESTLKRLYYNPVNDAIKSPMVTSSDDNDELIDISECFATYVNPIACNISPRHLLNIQHAFKTMIGKCVPTYFIGQHTKSDESSNTTSKNVRIEDRTSNDQNENGGILVITGSPGSGKTIHLAALAMSLATSDHHSTLMSSKDYTRSTSITRKSMSNSQSLAKYQILIHFTNGIPSTGLPSCKQLSKVLDHWIKCLAAQLQSLFSSSNILKMFLSKIKVNLDSTNTANDHHNLKLKMLCFNKMIWFLGCIPGLNYAFLIDDVDYLDPLILDDWLPSVLPKNVQFIFTCHSNSEIIQKLTCQYNKNTCSVYQIPQLTSEESRAVILSHLHSNGVSCVHSQLEYEIALLISACESNNPSYFNMVCKYLQLCGSHDELYADELDIICHLLTSPMFICRILSEYPSTLMRFLNGYPTTDRCIQEKWKRKLELCPFIDKIDAMKTFVCVNYEFLVKYPNSFCELAINQDSSEWIHTLGLSLLYLNDFGIKRQLDMNNSQILFRVNSPKCTLIKPMQRNMTYKPIVTSNGSMDVPTSVEMNPTAKVLVYGTRCGTITFVELSTMRELWSLTGHRSSVQSLCFLDGFPSKPENIKSPEKFISELRLMSASEDGDVYIWDASTVIHNVESKVHDKTVISQLASLCGYHRRCVTTSAWHPRRRLVATGDLDCMVYLWDVSEIGVKSSDLSTSVCSVRLHPVKSINVSSYPIISIAFRLPSVLSNEQEDLIHDDLAIGCWDGTIHFYNLSSLSIVRSLSASTSLCSLAYSPNGGNILATFDKDGVLMLWNDDILWYQGGLIQEYSCFTIEYSPYDQTDELIPNQYGKICFSKPNGQYILQSGGGQFLNNYINIWDTGLWGTFGPWIDVKPPQIGSGNPICVTCLTILPTYEHVLIGWSNGDLTVIRVFDGRLIHYLKAATEDNSSIQCITSSCTRSFSAFDAYHIIVGYASGAVRIFLCILRPKVSSHKDRYVYQSANAMSELHFQLIDTLWSHCINHNVNGGVPENEGTLCVASDFCVAVTGGGNAETWVHFIGRQTGSKIKKSVCLKEHNSAVIAVSMDSKFFATASKSRQLALYKFDPLERTVTLWHLIDDVGTATITSFYLLRMFLGVDTISISVYIGDSNSLLHNYAIIDKMFELKQTFDANKSPIKFMERVSNHLLAASDDGEVSVWKHDKHGALQFSHRLNVCTDMPSKNNSDNSTLEESYYLTSFFMFFVGYDSLKFERKLCSPTIETIDKLMLSNADNQHTESGDELKDPDSEVTSLSGCCMSNSNSYVTGSDQKIYECGYKIHIDIEEENKTYFIATDYLKDEQFHLLNSCKKGYIVYRDTSYGATYRLLYGVRLSCNKSSDCSQVIQDFRYRIFAPFILQYRGTLKGHSGLVPCTLTSGCTTNSDEDCIVASASGRTVCDVGCDIRLWSIPSKRKLLNYQPNQHFGPITCLGQLKITDHYSICISGCMDGSVMFWSLKNSEPLDLKHVSVADLTNNKSIKWKPLLHGFCSALRPKYAISDIATQTYVMDESKRTVQYLIYIAYGENLWRMRIILDQSNMSMNDVQNTFERLFSMNGKTELHFAELDVFWSSELDIPCSDIASFTASHPIVKISPRYAKPNELEQCEVIAVLVNGDVIVLTTNEHEKFSFDQCIVENGLWCSSIGTNVVGVFTTRSGMAFICRHTDESRTFHRISGYMGSCEKEMWINTLSVLSTVQEEGSHLLYLAECHLINCWKILICNENGDLVTDFTLDNSSIKVTGYCAKLLSPTEDNSSTLIYLIIATSDNILRVLGCAINNPITVVNSKQWKEVAMYPVETEITQLYTLDGDSQLKILAGDRQGQIHCFILL
ncbi:unnamed protein product [Schistosoma haematobium]|nr:unnamed protein product [Schistosoma haematobium]